VLHGDEVVALGLLQIVNGYLKGGGLLEEGDDCVW
jgi:hypothetical protein